MHTCMDIEGVYWTQCLSRCGSFTCCCCCCCCCCYNNVVSQVVDNDSNSFMAAKVEMQHVPEVIAMKAHALQQLTDLP